MTDYDVKDLLEILTLIRLVTGFFFEREKSNMKYFNKLQKCIFLNKCYLVLNYFLFSVLFPN